MAALEGGQHGIAFASGSAATAAIAELAGPGDEIVVGDDVYGGTFRYLEQVRRGAGIDARYVDLASGQDALWEALSERTRLVWFETPSNPHLKVVDIVATVATVARRGAEGGGRPLVVVDNTFASPALQRPLQDGADIVFHSATKYLAGHSDTILGVAVTSDPAVADRLRFLQNAMGAVPGPLDCFLVLRGLRTLHLRMARHGANALIVADYLRGRPDIEAVSYPAMSGMVSFLPTAGGRRGRTAAERAVAIVEATRLFTLAELLGGVESYRDPGSDDPHVRRRVTPGGLAGTGPPVGRDRGPGRSRRRPGAGPRRSLTRRRARRPFSGSRRSAPTHGRPARVARRPPAGA